MKTKINKNDEIQQDVKTLELPNKKYKIILADPPWKYVKLNFYEKKGVNEKSYERMELEDIKKLDVNSLAEDNSLLFLWVTNPFIKKGIEVLESWGFEYVTVAFVWVKIYSSGNEVTGMGRYTRSGTELVLLGKKGNGVKRINTNIHQVVNSRLKEHSRKPDKIRDLIVKLCGNVSKIELFARQRFEGWDVWGNEAPNECQSILSEVNINSLQNNKS